MGDIYLTSDSGSGAPYLGAFIQCVDSREPMIHELWCHGIDGICRKFRLTAPIEILYGTVGEFVTEYLSENGRRNRIIGEQQRPIYQTFWDVGKWISVYSQSQGSRDTQQVGKY